MKSGKWSSHSGKLRKQHGHLLLFHLENDLQTVGFPFQDQHMHGSNRVQIKTPVLARASSQKRIRQQQTRVLSWDSSCLNVFDIPFGNQACLAEQSLCCRLFFHQHGGFPVASFAYQRIYTQSLIIISTSYMSRIRK